MITEHAKTGIALQTEPGNLCHCGRTEKGGLGFGGGFFGFFWFFVRQDTPSRE